MTSTSQIMANMNSSNNYTNILLYNYGCIKLIVCISLLGTSKTIEGTLMSVLTQLCVLVLLTLIGVCVRACVCIVQCILVVFFFYCVCLYIDPQISSIGLTQTQWLSACGGIVLTSLLEAYTWQIDNLILSICLCFTFVTFL